MEMFAYIATSLAAIAVLAAIWFGQAAATATSRIAENQRDIDRLARELADAKARLDEVSARITSAIGEKSAAEASLDAARIRQEQLAQEANRAKAIADEAERRREAADMRASLAEQRRDLIEQQLTDWEATKQQLASATKAGALEAAAAFSSKLIEDSKRETAEARKQLAEEAERKTDELGKGVDKLTQLFSELNGKREQDHDRLETLHKMFASPSEAGISAEKLLETLLSRMGLRRNEHFFMQYSGEAEGEKFRADAVILLPGDAALVIDSKASRHVQDLAVAEREGDEAAVEAARAAIVATAQRQLKEFKSKDYVEAVTKSLKAGGYGGRLQKVLKVMFLPTEASLDVIRSTDAAFLDRAENDDVVVTTPNGIRSVVAYACMQIEQGHRIANEERIIETTKELIDRVAIALDYAVEMGEGLNTATVKYGKFAGSINSRVLPALRRIEKLGMKPKNGLPKALPPIEVKTVEPTIIDADADDFSAVDRPALPPA